MKFKRLGELLLARALVTEDQLKKAVEHQNLNSVRIGTALIDLGFVKETDVYDALAFQMSMERVNLHPEKIDSSFVKSFDEFLVRKYNFIPLQYVDGDSVKVAISDPLDVNAIDSIEAALRKRVVPVLANPSDIESVIHNIFNKQEVIKDLEKLEAGVSIANDTYNVEDVVGDTPIKQIMNSILKQALDERASDIHISSNGHNVVVKYRIDGVLHESLQLPLQSHASLIASFKNRAGLDYAEKRVPQDGRSNIKLGEKYVDLRAATIPTVVGQEKLTIRILDKSNLIMDINQLGFSKENLDMFKDMIYRPEGLILIVGPTGSGKSSTLYTSILEVHNGEKNILTIEDPVEYTLQGIDQVQVNEKAGLTFARGLRSMLRHDPDIILLGEMRDKETANVGLEAANTGHLVFSTLHTNDAVSTITRLKQMGLQGYQVASSLLCIVSQRLVRKVCEFCKETYTPTEMTPDMSFFRLEPSDHLQLTHGKGCDMCRGTGYRGRMPIQELLVIDGEIRKMIVNNQPDGDILTHARGRGMKLMIEDGLQKALQGLTTLDEIKRKIQTGGE